MNQIEQLRQDKPARIPGQNLAGNSNESHLFCSQPDHFIYVPQSEHSLNRTPQIFYILITMQLHELFSFIMNTHRILRSFYGWLRVKCLVLLGLNAGKNVCALGGTRWPICGLKDITIKNDVTLGFSGWFSQTRKGAKILIGQGTSIGDNFHLSADAPISIGNECLISYRVSMMTHRHHIAENLNPVTSGFAESKPINIGNRCFIGCNVVIQSGLSGVTLGNNCVIGANAVVTKSFPDNSVIGGVPARLIKPNKCTFNAT